METITYQVAEFYVTIQFADKGGSSRLLPSFTPFLCSNEADTPRLFKATVSDLNPAHTTDGLTEIGQFDCGGANHGVYRSDAGDNFFIISDVSGKVCSHLRTNAAFNEGQIALIGTDIQRSFGLNNALMILFAFAASTQKTLLMHSSVVCNEGIGYLFLGKSGTGKSTHTQLWLKHIEGSWLLNDDNPIVRLREGKTMVYGSPWSGKTPCYINKQTPVGAFVQLEQQKENRIERLAALHGFASLLSSCSTMIWDKASYNAICDTIAELLSITPIYKLECLPNIEAALLSAQTIRRK